MFSSIQENSDVTGFQKGQERQSAESALICGASQQGKIMHFLLWVFYNPSCTSFLPQMHSSLNTGSPKYITKTTFESLPLFHFIFSTDSGNEQIINFEGCSPFFYVLVFIVPAPFPAPEADHHIRQYLVIVWKEMCLNVCMFAVYSMYFKCIFTVRPPCQEDPAYCWSACSLR